MQKIKASDEASRLQALEQLKLLHSQRAPEFTAVVDMAAEILDCPISLISIVGGDEQWFKAKHGLKIDGIGQENSFSSHTIQGDDLLIVEDATLDDRFKTNPIVTGPPFIRFYAGYPISIDGKNKLGALCVIDTKPRTLTDQQCSQLQGLGKIVERLIVAFENNRVAREKTEELGTTLDNMDQGVSVFNKNAELALWNQQYVDIFDRSKDQITAGVTLHQLIEGEKARGDFEGDVAEHVDALRADLAEGRTVSSRFRLKSGKVISSVHAPMPHGGWVATHTDVTERAEMLERVEHASLHDGLTGLANRAKFAAEFDRKNKQVTTGKRELAVMLVDVDRFKYVNDNFGHYTGDRVLMEVANRLQKGVRGQDLVARLGGDEFAVLLDLDDITEAGFVRQIADRILSDMKRPITSDGGATEISVSIGVAIADSSTIDLETILARADRALYKVKDNGRGQCQFYNAQIASEISTLRKNDLAVRQACERGDFDLNFQPIIDLSNHNRFGFETLIRWNGNREDHLTPSELIESAEKNGSIVDIGAWVLNASIKEARTWNKDTWVAINISPSQLGRGLLVQQVESALTRWKFDATRLELEVTETALLQEDGSAVDELHQLKNMGIKIALDDFGTGYASMTYLQRFPFDKLKIDRSFVSGVELNEHSPAIIRAITNLAADMKIETIAEGIETKEQLVDIKAAGCTFGQGYFLGRPAPADQLFSSSPRIELVA